MSALGNLAELWTRFVNNRAVTYDEGWDILDIVEANVDKARAEYAVGSVSGSEFVHRPRGEEPGGAGSNHPVGQ